MLSDSERHLDHTGLIQHSISIPFPQTIKLRVEKCCLSDREFSATKWKEEIVSVSGNAGKRDMQ